MIRGFLNSLRQRQLRKTFRAGAEVSRFVARDVRRDIRVLDDSRSDDGYVTACVRTTNILYVSHKMEAAPDFGPPEILQLDRAWIWGGESWGGKEPDRPTIPLVASDELCNALRSLFPQADFATEDINPDHRSWRATMTVNRKMIDVFGNSAFTLQTTILR